jgi:hypothetical protein
VKGPNGLKPAVYAGIGRIAICSVGGQALAAVLNRGSCEVVMTFSLNRLFKASLRQGDVGGANGDDRCSWLSIAPVSRVAGTTPRADRS